MAQAVVAVPSASRGYADKPAPEKRATALLDLLPGNSIVSKTGWVTAGTGISALAISNELYVVNDETVILAGFLIFATLLGRTLSGPYQEWAQGQVDVSITELLAGLPCVRLHWSNNVKCRRGHFPGPQDASFVCPVMPGWGDKGCRAKGGTATSMRSLRVLLVKMTSQRAT